MTLTRAALNSMSLRDIEAMTPTDRCQWLEDLVRFWQENAREREALDRRRLGTIASYRWGE